eukprot:scaffold110230_cov66-Phaeocystis_antarctica.AAC.13
MEYLTEWHAPGTRTRDAIGMRADMRSAFSLDISVILIILVSFSTDYPTRTKALLDTLGLGLACRNT